MTWVSGAAQQYLKLPTRVTVALSKEPPFPLPADCVVSPSQPGLQMRCFSSTLASLRRGFGRIQASAEDDEGGLARCKSDLSDGLLHAGCVCAGLPADSLYLPWLCRRNFLSPFDSPREHSVCFGDVWPELTSLQMVSK